MGSTRTCSRHIKVSNISITLLLLQISVSCRDNSLSTIVEVISIHHVDGQSLNTPVVALGTEDETAQRVVQQRVQDNQLLVDLLDGSSVLVHVSAQALHSSSVGSDAVAQSSNRSLQVSSHLVDAVVQILHLALELGVKSIVAVSDAIQQLVLVSSLQIVSIDRVSLGVGVRDLVLVVGIEVSLEVVQSDELLLVVSQHGTMSQAGILQTLLKSTDTLQSATQTSAESLQLTVDRLDRVVELFLVELLGQRLVDRNQRLLCSLQTAVESILSSHGTLNLVDEVEDLTSIRSLVSLAALEISNIALECRNLTLHRSEISSEEVVVAVGQGRKVTRQSLNVTLCRRKSALKATDLSFEVSLGLFELSLVGLRSDDVVDIVIVVLTRHEHARGRHQQCSHKQ